MRARLNGWFEPSTTHIRGQSSSSSSLSTRQERQELLQPSRSTPDFSSITRTNQDKPLPPMPTELLWSGRHGIEYRSSWIDSDGEDSHTDADYIYPDAANLEYLQDTSSTSLPPSPLSPNTYGRPRAPTPSTYPHQDDLWSPSTQPRFLSPLASSVSPADSPTSLFPPPNSIPSQPPSSFPSSPLLRSASDGDSSDFIPQTPSFARPAKSSMSLPDPSQFPDPYPYRPSHHHFTSPPPPLSSAGSSSASARSSAYTSSGSALASGDYGHVHVVSGDDDPSISSGISSDTVMQLLASDSSSSARSVVSSRTPIDQTRWSESYSGSVRSRSSSIGNTNASAPYDNVPKLHEKPSYDMGWQTVDERDEVGVSEEETDDDQGLVEEDSDILDKEEERTSAIVLVEEGKGLIVQGSNIPIVQLHVEPGTTHLLIGSSTTPNAMPSFLTSHIPPISNTLLVLDISANFLSALPPVLALCAQLEELNIASNPLRVMPVFLAELTNLRVLIADSTGISNLPDTLVDLTKLHTLSVRRNKMLSLPSWLCLLPALQTLCLDGNPFQGPWQALVEPLLAKMPMTPAYPPSTPIFPLPSAGGHSNFADTDYDGTDVEDLSDPPSDSPKGRFSNPLEDEDHTITPERVVLGRAVTSPIFSSPASPATEQRGLTRTRTTPNRAYFNQSKVPSTTPTPPQGLHPPRLPQHQEEGHLGDREIRKMKSAGDLRRGKSPNATAALPSTSSTITTPPRPALSNYSSRSSSNLLNISPDKLNDSKRFGSLSGSSGSMTRPQLTQSLWDRSPREDGSLRSPPQNRTSTAQSKPISPVRAGPVITPHQAARTESRERPSKEKGGRWGFLKKMSMGKMKIDSPSPAPSPARRTTPLPRPYTSAGVPSREGATGVERSSRLPQIDMRFSTTGTLGPLSAVPQLEETSNQETQRLSPVASSPNLLAPPSPRPRSAKRRSFLPIDTPISLNIPIPEASEFVPGITAQNDVDDSESRALTPSPAIDSAQLFRREEDRAREAYMRALRSVMAYLKDMNDLGLSYQPNPVSMYGSPSEEIPIARSRRPTLADGTRELSIALSGSTAVASEASSHLRSTESIAGLRSGSSTQTMSVATTDSTGSQDERKYKDDKSKRAMIIREIILTERTYVKGLQELVDIYVKPGCMPVNLLSGVGTSKDTVVPASERRVVFGGVDSLFSFHRDSFLPALEVAAAPLMRPSAELQEKDADGQLSLSVTKAVGDVFLKHTAFMRMYSSYINNFDNSVQRIKYWSADRNTPGSASPSSALSPSSSTAQLVGLGISMTAISGGAVLPDSAAATGVPNLNTGQRKRIKQYLKRCRMNPRHSQLNLEGYLLLPVQRIPRYKLLLEELLKSRPQTYEYMEDPLDRALSEITVLATNMNEGKRESESRRKLVQWQLRIRGKFPSPLVQPHRRLIMDGSLLLTRVVRKTVVSFEAINAQGDSSTVQVDCLAPELTPRPLIGILCNDLLVLCRDPSDGQDHGGPVDLWAVLRMQTLPQPASIVHGNALRLVDNKAILYFDAPSPSDALNWYRAINLHIPASKT